MCFHQFMMHQNTWEAKDNKIWLYVMQSREISWNSHIRSSGSKVMSNWRILTTIEIHFLFWLYLTISVADFQLTSLDCNTLYYKWLLETVNEKWENKDKNMISHEMAPDHLWLSHQSKMTKAKMWVKHVIGFHKTSKCFYHAKCINLYFISRLLVTSHESNTCSVIALQTCLHATPDHMGPLLHDQLNAKNADIEKALLSSSYKVTIKFVTQRLFTVYLYSSKILTILTFKALSVWQDEY